ncbi:MAG: helix-turn-helix transcriptional regulator [Acetobacteraceae bacterium]|nr:helix-turn-helix transcriptional regulator [Acetobacteraceae bacterium]
MAKDYIEANSSHDLPLAELASVAGLSEPHFARAFRLTTGDPPHRFVVRRRVERAKALLRDTEEPVSQIALASGFASHSHLSTRFRRLVGVTPSAFRDAAR